MKHALIKSALIGGLIVFIWGMISWVVLPFHKSSIGHFQDEQAVAQVIQQNVYSSGVYRIPSSPSMSQQQNMPYVFASVRLEGRMFSMPVAIVMELIASIVAAGLITWLLLQTKGLRYGKKVAFVTVVGLIVGILSQVPAWTWLNFPGSNALLCLIDLIIGWFLAGLAIGKIVKR